MGQQQFVLPKQFNLKDLRCNFQEKEDLAQYTFTKIRKLNKNML